MEIQVDIKVTVTKTASGYDFTYNQKHAQTFKSDKVSWKLETKEFEPDPPGFCVSFVDPQNPLDKKASPFNSNMLCTNSDQIPKTPFGSNTGEKVYPYTVKLNDPNVPPDDPEIIIIEGLKHKVAVLVGVGVAFGVVLGCAATKLLSKSGE